MKNITLAVEDDVLRKVKILAAERHTTVNAMVRDFLKSIAEKDRRQDEARQALLRLAGESKGDMGKNLWKREALYDR